MVPSFKNCQLSFVPAQYEEVVSACGSERLLSFFRCGYDCVRWRHQVWRPGQQAHLQQVTRPPAEGGRRHP